MKCYKCNGTGVYDIYNDCPVCDGTGEYDPNDKGFGLPQNDNDIKVPPFTDGQKQLIEMTEKLAKKRGGKICDVDGIDDDITGIIELLEDTISRIEGLNNEEWLRSCNTEQLAEEIVNLTLLDKYKLYDKMESAEYDIGIGVGAKKVIVEWLKQPKDDTE